MFTFLKHLGVGIISAFTAFTGAFHSQQATTTPTLNDVNKNLTEVTTNLNAKNNTPSKQNLNRQEQVSPQIFISNPTDYFSYQNIPSDFSKNPPYYIGSKVKINGKVIDFMAAGDRGGSSNYLEIIPNSLVNIPHLAISVSSNDYQKIVSNIDKYDTITVYGIISVSQNFTNTDGFTTTLIPVINASRIDKCNIGDVCTISGGQQTIFPYIPVTNISKENQSVSLGKIFQNPDLYTNTILTTNGKVINIFTSDTDGNSLVFIQDSNDGRGIASFLIESASLIKNQVKVGTNVQIKGLLLTPNGAEAEKTYFQYHIVNPSLTQTTYYIINGSVYFYN